MRLLLIHWNQAEATALARTLRTAGHHVRAHWSQEAKLTWGDEPPDAVVISLDRLPSHGRAIAEWIWEAKQRQQIPILFTGGKADKVAATRQKFPQGIFCTPDATVGELKKLT